MGNHNDEAIFYEPIDHDAFRKKYPLFDTEPEFTEMIMGPSSNPCAICGVDLPDHGGCWDASLLSLDCPGWTAVKPTSRKSRLLQKVIIYSIYFIAGASITLIVKLVASALGIAAAVAVALLAVTGLAVSTSSAVSMAVRKRRR